MSKFEYNAKETVYDMFATVVYRDDEGMHVEEYATTSLWFRSVRKAKDYIRNEMEGNGRKVIAIEDISFEKHTELNTFTFDCDIFRLMDLARENGIETKFNVERVK